MDGCRLLSGVLVAMIGVGVVCMVESSEVAPLRLSAFNIRIFGVSKSRKVEVMDILSKVSSCS